MKLRLGPGAIRLRLQPGEVERAAADGACHTELPLGSGGRVLTYGVELTEAQEPGIDWTGDRLWIRLPRTTARAWLEGEREGLRITLETAAGPVELRVETDRHPDAEPRRGT